VHVHYFLTVYSERALFFDQVKYLGVAKCLTEGWRWYSETSEITILCSN